MRRRKRQKLVAELNEAAKLCYQQERAFKYDPYHKALNRGKAIAYSHAADMVGS